MSTPSQVLLARNGSHSQAEPAFVSASARPYANGHVRVTEANTDKGKNGSGLTSTPATIPLRVHPTFSADAENPGTVLIIVEGVDFWCHRDMLIFSSSFFECLLMGDWRETQSETSTWPGDREVPVCIRKNSINRDSSLTRSAVFETRTDEKSATEATSENHDDLPDSIKLPFDGDSVRTVADTPENDAANSDIPEKGVDFSHHESRPSLSSTHSHLQPRDDRVAYPDRLDNLCVSDAPETWTVASTSRQSFVQRMEDLGVQVEPANHEAATPQTDCQQTEESRYSRADNRRKFDARIRLRDEKASSFQDFLYFIYPHLELSVDWTNCYDLMSIARKFDMPFLKRHCIAFLLSSCAGKPLNALKIAEDFELPELYKEASRYVLDQFNHWEAAELEILTERSLLKLEKRRTFFLERLLRLGLINQSREYTCAVSCPEPQLCARLLEEKWRSAFNSAFRFGPAQPSIIYRSLRQLEPSLSSPALHLPHTACQTHAKQYVADLFDRMFSIGSASVHNTFSRTFTGTNATLRQGFDTLSARQHKYFLYVDLYDNAAQQQNSAARRLHA